MRSTRQRFAPPHHDHGDRLPLRRSVERVALNGACSEVRGDVLSEYLQKRAPPKAADRRLAGRHYRDDVTT